MGKESEWISVKDRLPETADCVLVLASGKPHKNITLENACEIAEFDIDEGWIMGMWPEWENPNITYWMPLPEPPKGDKK